MSLSLPIGNTTVARLTGVKASGAEEYDDTGSFSVTMTDQHGAPLAGQSWPTPMQSMGGGEYVAQLSHEIAAECGHIYVIEVSGSVDTGQVLYICDTVEGVARGA